MKRIHVKGNTWVLEGPQLVGLYQIDESTCLLLDPGSTKLQGEIEAALAQAGLTPVGVLCTHMHYDHCFGAAFMWETFHVGPEFNRADEPIYKGMGAEIFGPLAQVMKEGLTPAAARYLTEGDEISFGHHTLTVLSTPGHTPGGICFYCAAEKAVFVGDTLFYCSVGRTDFPGGDSEALCESFRNKLFTLPEDTRVYPGHGPHTEIGFEKAHNPYIG